MTSSELIEVLCEDLRLTYGCHTAILYGSRARDDWEARSDIDVIALRDTGGRQRVAISMAWCISRSVHTFSE